MLKLQCFFYHNQKQFDLLGIHGKQRAINEMSDLSNFLWCIISPMWLLFLNTTVLLMAYSYAVGERRIKPVSDRYETFHGYLLSFRQKTTKFSCSRVRTRDLWFIKQVLYHRAIELFKVGGSSAMQLSNQSDTPEVLYNLFLRIKTGVPL